MATATRCTVPVNGPSAALAARTATDSLITASVSPRSQARAAITTRLRPSQIPARPSISPTPVARYACREREAGQPYRGHGPAAAFGIGGVAGPFPDLAKVSVLSSGPGERPSLSEPSWLGSWARSVARASETSPADAAERSADRSADAAVRDELPARASGAATAPDVGTPPWGAGRSLSLQERAWHESRVGANLGDIRVHEGAAPARWAGMLGARAFTLGRDVVFGSGEYAPGTQAGRRLMAHELSHVIAGRGRAPVLARVALTPADFDALADSVHGAVGSPTSEEELIYVALQKLERDAAAIASMKSAYKKRFKVELLTDLGTRLKGHGLGLAKTLLGEKGLAIATAPPGKPAEFESASRAVHAALVAQTIDPEGVYAALIPLGRTAVRVAALKTTYRKLFTTDLEADLAAKLADADLSYALYLLEAPGAASSHSPASTAYVARPGFGASPTTATVGGGTVSAGTAVPYSYQPKDPAKPVVNSQFGFGYGYTGALSSDTRWLQFIEREIDSTTHGTSTAVPGDVTIQSNTYPLTTNAAQPSWFVDSYDASNPFFDETHADTSWRDATSVSAYDAPSPIEKLVKAQFNLGATLVTSRAHFDIYMIRDFAPLFHIEVEMVWTFTAIDKHKTTRTVKSTGAVTSLPGPQKKALAARYPAFAYIQ